MPPSPLVRLRKICLALPDTTEVKAWGEPTFRVRNKIFAMYAAADNHHGAGHHAVWLMSTHVTQLAKPAWEVGLVVGVLLSAPDAVILPAARVPIMVIGAIGGTLIGWIVGRFGA